MDDKRISRREMLRNLGLAGAAVWAAPVLTSRRASASVERCTKKQAHKLCRFVQGMWDCGACGEGFNKCGTCSSDVGDGSYCFARYGDHRCFCAEDQFCSETHACTTDADCSDFAEGVCITANGCTGCDSRAGVCTTRCCSGFIGSAPALKPRRLGRTTSGR